MHEVNSVKKLGSDKFVPRVEQMLTGFGKDNPAVASKMPVEEDVPEFLSDRSRIIGSSELFKAVDDLALIGFYYLLRVGEYTVKRSRNKTKQTKQFKLEDCTFFKKNAMGQ